MSLLLKNRDYVRDGNGGVAVASGGEALLNEVLFRLTARRESFPFLPKLGSRMGELRREKPSDWDALAQQFAVEALNDLEDVTVTGARVRRDRDALLVTADLLWQGETLSATARWEE